jgi:hypothetical protein
VTAGSCAASSGIVCNVSREHRDRRGSLAWKAGLVVDSLGPLLLGVIVVAFLIALWLWGQPPFGDG